MSWHSPAYRSPRKRWTSSWLTILRGFEELLACADGMAPGHRDALLHGLLDAADGLNAGQCRQLVGRALRSGIARVRRAALDRLCGLDGPGTALPGSMVAASGVRLSSVVAPRGRNARIPAGAVRPEMALEAGW